MSRKEGFLPIYVHFNREKDCLDWAVGCYAVAKDFHHDTPTLKAWCVPFPMNVSFLPNEEGAMHLRSCGNSEETIAMICVERDYIKWINYFSKRKELEKQK